MFSSPLILVLIIVAALLPFLFARRSKPSSQTPNYPYEKQSALFTPAERSFLGVLEHVLSSEYKIFGKANLADVIKVRRGLSKSERQSALNRINRKHLDFVICTADTLDIACVIELDDKSHQAQARKERDTFLEGALRAAGVPIVRFPAKQAYELAEVQAKLSRALPSTAHTQTPNREVAQALEENAQRACPKCGAELVVRTAKCGRNAGQEFLACSAYPACKTTLALS